MPQLSPMLGFLMFFVILSSYLLLVCSFSKGAPYISSTKGLSQNSEKHFQPFIMK
uniref:ATP synthase F0 subunit 8 n=1 Tax=Chromodoris annae TaxID=508118 RepID=A0A343RAP2_9GAST|nr:ATP synthase F0 subunit 8 [Chromodoris annae]ATX68410.1 ATP synthase F0 subunit 8 [Chromodoris annae]